MVQTKKALQEQVENLKQENEQFRFCLKYTLFDVEATKREKDGLKAQVILLREELADLGWRDPAELIDEPTNGEENAELEDGGLIG